MPPVQVDTKSGSSPTAPPGSRAGPVESGGAGVAGISRAGPVELSRAKLVGLAVVFLWFSLGGIAHFAATDLEMSIVPPAIPWPRAAVLVSGLFELLGAAGILYRPLRRAALWGLFVLTLAVTPCHFYMLEHPERFHVPYWALVARLPLQAALLTLIAWGAALTPR